MASILRRALAVPATRIFPLETLRDFLAAVDWDANFPSLADLLADFFAGSADCGVGVDSVEDSDPTSALGGAFLAISSL